MVGWIGHLSSLIFFSAPSLPRPHLDLARCAYYKPDGRPHEEKQTDRRKEGRSGDRTGWRASSSYLRIVIVKTPPRPRRRRSDSKVEMPRGRGRERERASERARKWRAEIEMGAAKASSAVQCAASSSSFLRRRGARRTDGRTGGRTDDTLRGKTDLGREKDVSKSRLSLSPSLLRPRARPQGAIPASSLSLSIALSSVSPLLYSSP